MASKGMFFAVLLSVAAFACAAEKSKETDGRLFSTSGDTSVTIGSEAVFYIALIFVGLLIVSAFLGIFDKNQATATPYEYVPASAYAAPAPAYDEHSTFAVHHAIDDAGNKYQ